MRDEIWRDAFSCTNCACAKIALAADFVAHQRYFGEIVSENRRFWNVKSEIEFIFK